MKPSVIIYAPQGAGKTRNAQRLREYFGLFEVIEADDDRRALPKVGALILTNNEELCEFSGIRTLSLAEAMVAAGIPEGGDPPRGVFAMVDADQPAQLYRGRPPAITAPDILAAARQHMTDRAAARDQPQGERSMSRTVAAFNALTGHNLSERDGWLFMVALKMARATTTPTGIADDYEDGSAYFALAGESAGRVCA